MKGLTLNRAVRPCGSRSGATSSAWGVLAPGLIVGALLGAAWVSTPEASADVSTSCRLHLERVEAATGQRITAAEDRRYWLERGQPARYCSESDSEADGSGRATAPPEQDVSEENKPAARESEPKKEDGEKSRYCKRRWFC